MQHPPGKKLRGRGKKNEGKKKVLPNQSAHAKYYIEKRKQVPSSKLPGGKKNREK